MHRKNSNRDRRQYPMAKLEMSSMIDVVFLLLIFFVVITKPRDIMARFEVSAPQHSTEEVINPSTTLNIVNNKYYVNNSRYTFAQLKKSLSRIRGLGDQTALVITSDSGSSHSSLVKILDMCSELKIKNLAVMSR